MLQPDESASRHDRAISIGTAASGIAESTLSIGDVASLSNFPAPPEGIPTTGLSSAFEIYPPSGSASNSSPPVTPTRNNFRMSPAGNSPSRRHGSPAGSSRSKRSFTSNQPSSPSRQRTFAYNDYTPLPPLNPSRLKTKPSTVFNKGEWHEGSSEIVVDDAEERMLSTSFITGLLSSADDITSASETTPVDPKKYYPPSYLAGDDRSVTSEMTYLPPGIRTPQPGVGRHDLDRSSPPLPPHPDDSQASQPLPPILMLDADERSIAGSIGTFDGNDPQGGSVIRTASMKKKLGALGASVVGVAPATLQKVPLSRRGSPSNNASTTSHESRRNESALSTFIPSDEATGQRLTVPDFYVPATAVYSPAQQSSIVVRTSTRSQTPRRQSALSIMSSFIPRFSAISSAPRRESRSIKQAVSSWFGLKPLPRLPIHPDMTIASEAEHRKADEALPLPELVGRAGTLSCMLEKGHYPHTSINSALVPNRAMYDSKPSDPAAVTHWEALPGGDGKGNSSLGISPDLLNEPWKSEFGDAGNAGQWPVLNSQKTKRVSLAKPPHMIAIGVFLLLLIALIIGLSVGLTLKTKQTSQVCPGNFTGNACNLDATCVCTSSLPGQCDALAKNLISLIPSLNNLFNTNYTLSSLSAAVWEVQGAPPSNQCTHQAVLVDVAPALDSLKAPNRTQWVQSAMLWNLVESQNMTALLHLQNFISKAPWSELAQVDGPVSNPSSKFSLLESGFIFDFAAQTVVEPTISFVSNGQPSSAQIAQVGNIASDALDRMYSFALASSTQRQQALSKYWQSTLGQKPEDLAHFMTAISTSPILLPFDATAAPGNLTISSLLTNSTSAPFPVPLACYPYLDATKMREINTLETTVFNLASASVASQFDTSCFPDRPIYGVLDVLQLRLPFIDSRTGVAKQAAVLTRDVAPRAVVYSGEILSALPGTPQTQNVSGSQQLDPHRFGTLNNLNHVLLEYLSSISDINVANALVEFVLSSPTVPPLNTSDLYKSLSSIPALEVAVFGTVNPSDLSYTVSSLSTPSGSLFFGSDQSLALRNWAITKVGSSVVWTESAGSPQVVRDSSFLNANFDSVWTPAYNSLHSTQTGVIVGVGNITNAFEATAQFSP